MQISKEVKVGLIATIIIALSVWGYNFLKGKNILKPTDEYYAVYDKVDGLIESSNVTIKGYKVGTVNEIFFDHSNTHQFIVKFSLEERIKIPINTVAKITSSSPIVPAKDIQLVFSEKTIFHQPGDTINSLFDGGLMSVLDPLTQQSESILSKLDSTIGAINNIMSTETQFHLKETIRNVNEISTTMEKDISPMLVASMHDFKKVSASIGSKAEEIEGMISNLKSISDSIQTANLKHTLLTLDSTLVSTKEIIAKINNAEGSVGLMINDSALYNNLSSTANSLDLLLNDLRERPKRYVHFSLFGKKDKSQKEAEKN